ncbi:unnamed protein product [Litomosoides sigmodontis]|uniref:HTH psq-type domain-containing protein n=1 Tax=Litomosoides sigmodontis TaxID=42156 RepID=A0A3P6TLZ4_LITSI|nr:unnamed protein product [Litomosoides sigmodontis]
MSKNSQCQSIANVISAALTTEPAIGSSATAEDWSPNEQCPFCDGLRIFTDDYTEKDSMKIEPENENTTSDSEYYGAGCSKQSATNSSPESTGNLESSSSVSSSQSRLSYMHPFSNICTPSILPVMAPFVPLPEIANQLFCQSLLQWSTSNMLLQQLTSQRSVENLHNPLSEQYLLARKKSGTIMGSSNENDNVETNHHLIQHMIPSISTESDNVKRPAHTSLSKSPFGGSESRVERFTTIYTTENSSNGAADDEQPLDLSLRCALQSATQCAVSSAHSSRDERRLRALIDVIADKSSNSLLKDEENNSVISHVKNTVVGARTMFTASMSKRNYTQADLDAAVQDIRCGRLGTRRASVVYGIPRSTLRNKIYKLDAADNQRTNGGGGRKTRISSFGTTILATSRVHSPSTTTVPFPNDPNIPSTRILLPPTQPLITIDGISLPEIIQDICPNNRPHFANQQPINANDGTIIESNKLLWSPYDHQQISEPKNAHTDGKKIGESPTNSTESQSDWKKSRPKRGQYRKYKKDALDEAVRSVRRGEMSVHRAGSFYGVPHSTLEYKVKERNLTRTKCKKATVENIFDVPNSARHTNCRNAEGDSSSKNLANQTLNSIADTTTAAMQTVNVLTAATSAVLS